MTSAERVAVVGTGLIGTSIAMAAVRAGEAVRGFDADPDALARAAERSGLTPSASAGGVRRRGDARLRLHPDPGAGRPGGRDPAARPGRDRDGRREREDPGDGRASRRAPTPGTWIATSGGTRWAVRSGRGPSTPRPRCWTGSSGCSAAGPGRAGGHGGSPGGVGGEGRSPPGADGSRTPRPAGGDGEPSAAGGLDRPDGPGGLRGGGGARDPAARRGWVPRPHAARGLEPAPVERHPARERRGDRAGDRPVHRAPRAAPRH